MEEIMETKPYVLISCSGAKHNYRAKAKDIYTGCLFIKSLKYARSLMPENIFVLSAKHHLLRLEDEICPYDLPLKEMPARKRKCWAKEVCRMLKKRKRPSPR